MNSKLFAIIANYSYAIKAPYPFNVTYSPNYSSDGMRSMQCVLMKWWKGV